MPGQRYSQEELRGILETAISKLAPRYRIVFHLRDIEGFSSKETAQTLHLSLATVKSRARRARLQLRDLLDVYFRPMKGKPNVWSAASPQAKCEDVTSWSAQMYTAFVGVNHSWPGWNALRSLPH